MTLSHDQPGLEVAPESELHVVQAQTVNQAPPQSPGQYAYGHQPQTQPGNAYLSGAYSPSGYPPGYPPSYPAIASPSQAYWKGSQDGTHITDGDLPKPAQPTILGLRKTVFWLIFGSLIALFVVGLAIGLGVGLGVKHNDTTSGYVRPKLALYLPSYTLFSPYPLTSVQVNIQRNGSAEPYSVPRGERNHIRRYG